jgi:dTDP-4-dehydrorhamnose 3,5-epimerase
MQFIEQEIAGLYLIESDPYVDERGAFRRHYCEEEYKNAGLNSTIKQTNISENNTRGTLRGFHYQLPEHEEDKTLAVLSGKLYNVVIDVRQDSPTYLTSVTIELDARQRQSLYVPTGCANAFLTLENNTVVFYLMSSSYRPECSRGFRYDDPYFNISWPFAPLSISEKDANYQNFNPS